MECLRVWMWSSGRRSFFDTAVPSAFSSGEAWRVGRGVCSMYGTELTGGYVAQGCRWW